MAPIRKPGYQAFSGVPVAAKRTKLSHARDLPRHDSQGGLFQPIDTSEWEDDYEADTRSVLVRLHYRSSMTSSDLLRILTSKP